jgi:integrase
MLTKKIKGVYHFRKVTPAALKDIIKRSELSLSLRTTDEARAKLLASRLNQILSALCVDYRFKLISKEDAVTRLEEMGFQCRARSLAISVSGQVNYDTLFRKFSQEQANNGKWTLKTQKEYAASFALFQRYSNEVEHREINHQFLISYRDTVRQLPPNLEKTSKYKGRKIHEVIKDAHDRTLSNRQINKYLVCLTSFFKWLELHEYIRKNPAHNLLLPKNSKISEERCAYSVPEIEKIINTLIGQRESFCERPERFWTPIIGAYTGMRLGEICQLHVEDVKSENGLLCFDVNFEGSRRLKNVVSQRLVPIHNRIMELGFSRYVDYIKIKNERLFPLLTLHSVNGYGHQLGKWFANFNRKYISQNPKKTFHSIRHSVANELKQLQIPGEVISELLGHKVDSITMSRYGKRYRPKVLLSAIERLPW